MPLELSLATEADMEAISRSQMAACMYNSTTHSHCPLPTCQPQNTLSLSQFCPKIPKIPPLSHTLSPLSHSAIQLPNHPNQLIPSPLKSPPHRPSPLPNLPLPHTYPRQRHHLRNIPPTCLLAPKPDENTLDQTHRPV